MQARHIELQEVQVLSDLQLDQDINFTQSAAHKRAAQNMSTFLHEVSTWEHKMPGLLQLGR